MQICACHFKAHDTQRYTLQCAEIAAFLCVLRMSNDVLQGHDHEARGAKCATMHTKYAKMRGQICVFCTVSLGCDALSCVSSAWVRVFSLEQSSLKQSWQTDTDTHSYILVEQPLLGMGNSQIEEATALLIAMVRYRVCMYVSVNTYCAHL